VPWLIVYLQPLVNQGGLARNLGKTICGRRVTGLQCDAPVVDCYKKED
jgi:hypothetical protein